MQNEAIINRLLTLEAQAERMREDCRRTIKLLEGVSTPSVPRGNQEKVAKAISKRNQRISKKHI